MARPPRIDFPDALYHVTSRGNGRQQIFWTDDDRQRFLGQIDDGVDSAAIVLYAFAMLDNVFTSWRGRHGPTVYNSCSG